MWCKWIGGHDVCHWSLIFVVIKDILLQLGHVELASCFKPFKVTILLLVLVREFVQLRIKLTSQRRTSQCLQKIWRSNDLLYHPITLFFVIKVLFKSVHVDSFEDFDESHWIRDLINESFPGSKNERSSHHSTRSICYQHVERFNTVSSKEWTANKHAEKREIEPSEHVSEFVTVHIFFRLPSCCLVSLFVVHVFTLVTRIYLHVFQLILQDDSWQFSSTDEPDIWTSKL